MGVYAGPETSESGLILALDARNSKTYDSIPGTRDHGISDWYCFQNTTVLYSSIYPGTQIIEIDANGVEVGIVTTSSTEPQRGTFGAIAGRRYYATKATHFKGYTSGNEEHLFAPVSYAGTSFANYMPGGRGTIQTYFVYSPTRTATVSFYDNSATGITGIATTTRTVSAGSTTVFTSTNQNTWQYISSDQPIIASVTGEGWDCTILGPATNFSYNRYLGSYVTVNATTPTNASGNVVYDTGGRLSVNTTIADGSGGNTAQGIGTAYMTNTYSWGDVLSDYGVIAPYPSTIVDVSYYVGGGIWSLAERHSLNGSLTSPDYAFRDGNLGFGVPGTTVSGLAANLAAGANLWKFEGNNPFAVVLNDAYDDEEQLLGWMNTNADRTSSNVNQSFVNLVNKENRRRPSVYGTTFGPVGASDYFEFDGINDYINCNNSALLSTTAYTKIVWFYPTSFATGNNIISGTSSSTHAFWLAGTNKLYSGHNGNWYTVESTTTLSLNTWYCGAVTFSTTSGWNLYLNGLLENTNASTTTFTGSGLIQIGAYDPASNLFTGRIANVSVYNRALTASEIRQNFNATRGRFGI